MILASKRKTKLSLAVLPRDAFSPGEKLKGEFSLRVHNSPKAPLRHPMGYFLFMDLPDGPYTIQAQGSYYFPKTIPNITVPDPLKPVVAFEIEPNPSYPFPEGTTLLKGIIMDAGQVPLPDVTILIKESDRTTVTNVNGAFVFYFKNMTSPEMEVKLKITKEGYKTENINYTIQKGLRKIVSISLTK